jgi:hypothetical protein
MSRIDSPDPYTIAYVVMEDWSNVPYFNPTWCPCGSYARLFVDNDFGARGGLVALCCSRMPRGAMPAWTGGGVMRDPCMRLGEISACGNNLSHKLSGRLWSVLISPAMK